MPIDQTGIARANQLQTAGPQQAPAQPQQVDPAQVIQAAKALMVKAVQLLESLGGR